MKKINIVSKHGSTTTQSISARNFFNSAFKTFSLYDNVRSIPGIDGLKPSQRKAIYGTYLKGENANFHVVARLAASIAELTDYHHGTGSMESTLAGLAAVKYAGSNNMNLFSPKGQFGSRLTRDPGAGRYIKTKLSENFRMLCKKEDDIILEHHIVDGEKIEPKFYLPILPLALINGATGIGTGHSVEIKPYHPMHVRDATLKVLDGKKLVPGTLVPWFRALGGFKGSVSRNENGQIVTTGKLEVVNSTTIMITELPVGRFLDDYKAILNRLEEEEVIKDYEDSSTEQSFCFKVTVPRSTTAMSEDQLYQKFKLVARESENFTLWNAEGVLQRFESAEDIITMYTVWRLSFYEKRRQKLMSDTAEAIRWMSEQIRFIRFYLANVKLFRDTSKKELIALLLSEKFADYDKLLGMPIWNLTKDKIAELEKKLGESKTYYATLESDTANDMYKRELKAFKYEENVLDAEE
jgi:DNA topoisomerase-2